MTNAPVTQQELARRLGVTQMTVSRALNGKGRMAPATRERVIQLAKELGYRPNGMARRVQEGRYRGLALLGSASRAAYNIADPEFHMAVGAALEERSWHLTEAWLPGEGLADPAIVGGLLDRLLADAVVMHDVGAQPPVVEAMIASHRVPAVWVNTGRERDGVDFDDAAGAAGAVAHLLAQGYRKPAIILPGPPEHPELHLSVRERRRGFATACAHAGIPARVLHPARVVSGEAGRLAGIEFMASVLDGPDRPDAIVCYAWITLWMMRALAGDRGLRIGPDLGLIGFAKPGDTVFDRPLTVCSMDYARLGREAVAMAWRKLDTGEAQEQVRIPLPLANPGATTSRNAP